MGDTATADALQIKKLLQENAANLKKIKLLEMKKTHVVCKDDVRKYWTTQTQRAMDLLNKSSINPVIYSSLQYDYNGDMYMRDMTITENGDDDGEECDIDCEGYCNNCCDNLLNQHPMFIEEVRKFTNAKPKKTKVSSAVKKAVAVAK
tara:strand:- start:223 stop:666 length:444 start_codon:yes stop_codon:yes gene_type:complete